VAIIDDAETLSEEAANSLLKTLEEPKNRVIVILISDSRDSLPATVVSRLQVINFSPVPEAEILTGLLDRGASRETAELLAKLAQGKPGQAIDFLSDKEKLEKYREKAEWFFKILRGGTSARLRLIEDCIGSLNKEELSREACEMLNVWETSLRDLAHLTLDNWNEVVNSFMMDKIAPLVPKFGGKILIIKHGLDEARALIAANVQSELAFKNIFLNI
jgi:DNA polymerase-3 subunit delta'